MSDNERPSLRAIRECLISPREDPNRMRVSRAAQKGTLVRIARGIYLPASTLEGHPLWLQKTIIRGSRICALTMRRGDYVLTGECAGWILGLPVDTDRGPIMRQSIAENGNSSSMRFASVPNWLCRRVKPQLSEHLSRHTRSQKASLSLLLRASWSTARD